MVLTANFMALTANSMVLIPISKLMNKAKKFNKTIVIALYIVQPIVNVRILGGNI